MSHRRLVVPSLVVALVAGLAAAPGAGATAKPRARLVAFDSCRALVGYAHRHAAGSGGVGVPVRALGGAPEGPAQPVQKMNSAAGEDAPTAAPAPSATDDASSGATTF